MSYTTIEITVPVTLTVEVHEKKKVKSWRFSADKVEVGGDPGMFSDASEAAGVWIPDENEWDHEGDYWKVSLSAKDWVRARIERT